jgi:hypothetical protein
MSDNDEKNKRPTIAELRRKISPIEAREAAAEASGYLASIIIEAGGEEFEVPQRGLLDDEQRERMEELELESEKWDHEDDIVYPERRITDKDTGTETIYPSRTEQGLLKVPYRKDGKLIRPAYPVRIAIALWGKDKYDRFVKAGGRAADVTGTLARLDQKMVEREYGTDNEGEAATPADPKSVGGAD